MNNHICDNQLILKIHQVNGNQTTVKDIQHRQRMEARIHPCKHLFNGIIIKSICLQPADCSWLKHGNDFPFQHALECRISQQDLRLLLDHRSDHVDIPVLIRLVNMYSLLLRGPLLLHLLYNLYHNQLSLISPFLWIQNLVKWWPRKIKNLFSNRILK